MRKSQRGFTLIELLIVIGIIGILMVALLPALTGVMGQGDAAATQARIDLLRMMIEKYSNKMGEYPPSEFSKRLKGVKVRADGTNSGIECLLIHLHQQSLGANLSLDDKADWLGNTDGDDNGSEIPRLNTTKKVEVVDAWLNPIVYFRHDSYKKAQEVMYGGEDAEGATATVQARKDGGDWINPRKYQLISAGEDGEFGTDDDICYPALVPK